MEIQKLLTGFTAGLIVVGKYRNKNNFKNLLKSIDFC